MSKYYQRDHGYKEKDLEQKINPSIMLGKSLKWKYFGKDVNRIKLSLNLEKLNLLLIYNLSDKVILDINMFDLVIHDIIDNKILSTLAIIIEPNITIIQSHLKS